MLLIALRLQDEQTSSTLVGSSYQGSHVEPEDTMVCVSVCMYVEGGTPL